MTTLLKNVSSVARDHLANERTFLAWTRTALAIIALGVALEKITSGPGTLLATIGGAGLVIYGIFILGYSIARFDEVSRELQNGMFPVARHGPQLISALAMLIGLGALAYIFI